MAWSTLAVACSSPQDRSAPGPLCDAEEPLEFEQFSVGFWFAFGDDNPRAFRPQANTSDPEALPQPPNPDAEDPIPGPCGRESTLFFRSAGHNDWGSGFGTDLSSRSSARDGSEYEGLAFWGRTERGHDKGLTLIINNSQNAWPSDVVSTTEATLEATLQEGDCTPPPEDQGIFTGQAQDDPTQAYGTYPGPTDCGNEFQYVLVTSYDWQLYLIPWQDFNQVAEPNRKPEGLDPSAIYQFSARAPRETSVALRTTPWMFYRHHDFEPPTSPSGGGDE